MGQRATFLGVPEMFELNAACQLINEAFGWGSTYLVGSSLEKRDYRDVDVRCILEDAKFAELFGADFPHYVNARWSLLCIAISHWLRLRTGLPVDFQIQPRTWANAKYPGARNALGLFIAPVSKPGPAQE